MVVITMKYLQRDQNNRFRYRRGIPKHVRVLFNGRSEFVKVLAKTEEEALQLYPKIHAHFEKQLKSALSLVPKKNKAKNIDPDLLAKTLENMGFHTRKPETEIEEQQRDSAIDQLLEPYYDGSSEGKGSYSGVPEETKELVTALRSGLDLTQLTLNEAFQFYLTRKAKTNSVERRKQLTNYSAGLKHLDEIVGGDLLLIHLTRRHAGQLRDHLMAQGLQVSTVKRYLKDIRAVLNYAAIEHDIPFINPFQKMELPKQSLSQRNHRTSMPEVVVQNVLEYLSTTPSKEPQLIFTLLYYTGARLAEITGLLKSDVHPDGPIPYLSVHEHAHRRLKNDWSNRAIPLSPAALECAKKALTLVPDSEFVFPRYTVADKRGSDSASAWLNKVIRKFCPDKKVVVHSLRHNFRDRIRSKGIHFETGKALEGHRYSLGEEANYGGGISLEDLYVAVCKVNEDL
jgi:integrase